MRAGGEGASAVEGGLDAFADAVAFQLGKDGHLLLAAPGVDGIRSNYGR